VDENPCQRRGCRSPVDGSQLGIALHQWSRAISAALQRFHLTGNPRACMISTQLNSESSIGKTHHRGMEITEQSQKKESRCSQCLRGEEFKALMDRMARLRKTKPISAATGDWRALCFASLRSASQSRLPTLQDLHGRDSPVTHCWAVVFDTYGRLGLSYAADTAEGRQGKVQRIR
jgi:hypothetical protein